MWPIDPALSVAGASYTLSNLTREAATLPLAGPILAPDLGKIKTLVHIVDAIRDPARMLSRRKRDMVEFDRQAPDRDLQRSVRGELRHVWIRRAHFVRGGH